ncbi:MAG: hypothetical protein J5809_08545 [Selenomonadaceae bacterium]|nr:hypothetical protein [Selenomonadaceae bacterium]
MRPSFSLQGVSFFKKKCRKKFCQLSFRKRKVNPNLRRRNAETKTVAELKGGCFFCGAAGNASIFVEITSEIFVECHGGGYGINKN